MDRGKSGRGGGFKVGYALGQVAPGLRTPLVVAYWVIGAVFGLLVLHDEIFSLRLDKTLAVWPLLLFAATATILTQVLYSRVTRHDGRPFSPVATLIFVLGNGSIEAFVFMAFARLGFDLGHAIWGDFGPGNFLLGAFAFIVYSGIIHAFYWVRVLPPHFRDDPALQPTRRALEPLQALIALSWTLLFFATGDIWTIVALHMIIDVVLMVRVRPPLFGRG